MQNTFTSQLSDFPEFPDGDPLALLPPELPPEDRYAARVLARLIQYGHVPNPAPELPEAWRTSYEAVMRDLHSPPFTREMAFRGSFAPRAPDALTFIRAVQAEMSSREDRLEQNRILYWADDALQPPPQFDWSIQDLFARPSLNLLVGNPGTKKTYLAIDLAVCFALGKPWLGRKLTQGAVLYIDEELGLHTLWGRFNSALKAHNSGWGAPLAFVSLGGYRLSDEYEAKELIDRALSIDAKLIIIDALANLMRETGESNLATMQPVLFNLRRLAEYCNAAVLVVHHTNRHGVFRGSSAISASVDLMLSIESEPTSDLVTLRTLKARFLPPADFCARASFHTAEDGTQRFLLETSEKVPAAQSAVPQLDTRQNSAVAILDFLLHNPGSTRHAITAHLAEFSPTTIRSVMHKLKLSGLIRRTNGSKKGKEAIYELSN